jgi:hypothetical protein
MDLNSSRFDSELQMFANEPRDPGLAHLEFLRWLTERGRLEHEPVGAPVGEYAFDAFDEDAAA